MKKYIIIKELPDASVGTEVIWDESSNAFYYEKSCFVSPHKRNYLSAGQVTQTPEYFCKAQEYPEYYAYKFPVYSREEVLKTLKDSFPNKSMSGEYNISASREIKSFEESLRKLGKSNAERIMGVRSFDRFGAGIKKYGYDSEFRKECECLLKLHISDVRYSYEDVEKHCNENGYYIGEYWFPFSDTK